MTMPTTVVRGTTMITGKRNKIQPDLDYIVNTASRGKAECNGWEVVWTTMVDHSNKMYLLECLLECLLGNRG